MPKGINGYVTVNDFITILMAALSSLKNKIKVTESSMQ